jgi:hypothetical protein
MPILDGGDPWGLPAGETGVLDGGGPTGLPVGGRGVEDGGGPTGLPFLNDTQNILFLSARELQDVSGRRWDKLDVLLPYLNLGLIEILNLKPDAFVSEETVILDPGASQSFPSEMIQLVDVTYNITPGVSPLPDTIGSAIRTVKKEIMDSMYPGWMTSTADATVLFVVLDKKDPKRFYVYPPQPAGTTHELLIKITKQPDQVVSLNQDLIDIPFDASYQPALIDYIVYRVLSEETVIPNALNKSNAFYNKFLQDLGLKTNVEDKIRAEGQ